jgi:hypothetical protein
MRDNRGSLIALFCVAATAGAGCSSHREFRVASIGSDGSFEIAGDEDASGAEAPAPTRSRRAPLVTSGNVLMGSGSGVVNATIASGTITGVLGPSGQTVVGLVNGTTVVLNGSGGSLGDLVSLDLGAGQVVGGPSSLVGVNVLGANSGTHATVGTTSGTAGTSITSGGTTTGALLPAPSASGTVSGTVTGTVGGTVGGTAGGTVGGVSGGLCC